MLDEKIVETKKCLCSETFNVTSWDLELLDKIAPVIGNKKYPIPTPTLCPACREQRRMSFRNERNLYRTKSDATGKNLLSIYSPDKGYKVFEKTEWLSDKWNALDYGRDFDFNRSFASQFEELSMEVPKQALTQDNAENSDYTNRTWNVKDCYLSFITGESENSHYLYWCMHSNDSVDCSYIQNSDLCYECTDIIKCYNLQFSQNCNDCRDSRFLYNCNSCKDCFGCSGLQNKQYYIFNKPYTKEEYEKEILSLKITSSTIPEYLMKMKKSGEKIPVKFYIGNGNENVSGNYINNSKNLEHCFDVGGEIGMENCKYSTDGGWGMADCMDSTHGAINYKLAYESLGSMDGTQTIANIDCWGGANRSYYCSSSFSINDCFGCIGLRNAQYCILNKEYSKEEYEALVPKIIEHMTKTHEWGEFFPSSISPFGYNETMASEYYPLTKAEVKSGNIFKWSDYENPKPEVSKIIPASKLPEDINEIPDDIINWAIECEVTGKPFRIIKQELDFYRKQGLPIPKKHPDLRHLNRIKLRNPRKLYDRNCAKCSVDIRTTYSPDRSEIVFCESCYDKEM